LVALVGDGKPAKTLQVTLKIGGKLFANTDNHEINGSPTTGIPFSPPLAATRPRRQRSASLSIKQEKGGADADADEATSPKEPPPAVVPAAVLPLGRDGNTFYCSGCGEVGDVVCCDGCPRVYHRGCVPSKSPSKVSLDQDDDPWFCPDCFPTKNLKSKDGTAGKDNTSHTCFQCNERDTGLKQCESCEGWIHFPSCPGDEEDDEDEDSDDDESPRKRLPPLDPSRILCRICRVEELEDSTSSPASLARRQKEGVTSKNNEQDDEDEDDNDEDEDMQSKEGSPDDDDEDGEDASKADSKNEDEADDDDIAEDDDENASRTSDMDVDGEDTKKLESKKKTSKDSKKPSSSKKQNAVIKSAPALAVKKRSRPSLPSSKVKAMMELEAEISSPASPHPSNKKKKMEKKKKKKKGESSPTSDLKGPLTTRSLTMGDDNDGNSIASSSPNFATSGGVPKAIPAFFYFLNENRLKLERSLARRHRIFNRLPKGYDRNELIAREGAQWWSKLRDSEIRRYMTMSMRDFEQRIIEWKEEKNIRDMLSEDGAVDEDENEGTTVDDEMLTYENHQRLYLGTNVGSKPFKPEPGSSQNRVLLELLQDMRFHPMPMLIANRSEVEYGQMDFDRVTIPYFDVHGPFSTSVGDECLGCTRGWTHYCCVLKRRIPSIEHRSKLQPPLSSLMATRVGLGLRPRLPVSADDNETEESAKNLPLFATRDIPDVLAAKKLPMVDWYSLSDPGSRADDIVQFIEETVFMKVPEPPRPDFPGRDSLTSSGQSSGRRTTGQKRSYDTLGGEEQEQEISLNKCGRCRTVISTDTGCVPCRRAQLVINMSRRAPPGEQTTGKGSGSSSSKASIARAAEPEDIMKMNLKAQSVMCGRVFTRDAIVTRDDFLANETDTAIANGIARQRWTPFTVLPPHTLASPTPKSKLHHRPLDHRAVDTNDDTMDKVLTTTPKDPDDSASSDIGGEDVSVSSRSKEDAMDVDDDTSTGAPATTAAANSTVVETTRPTSKRLRSARMTASQADDEDDDRHELALKYKKEAEELNKKCVGVACCGILLALMRRDPLLLFASPVAAEGYSAIIKDPMDFGKIRNSVLHERYGTLSSFVSDCRLLCSNALLYNPPGSIYWKTAKELYDILTVMQKRVHKWMTAIKDAHAMAWRRIPRNIKIPTNDEDTNEDYQINNTAELSPEDPFAELRTTWPEAVEMLEDSDWLRRCISADFMRTRENENAYYGGLAVRRTAAAAEVALAAYPDSGGVYNPVTRRSHLEDEGLRRMIDERVESITHPVELKDLPSWKEDAIIRVLRRAQGRRLDGISGSVTGCARCDGIPCEDELRRAKVFHPLKKNTNSNYTKRNVGKEASRIHPYRMHLSTGMASQSTRHRIKTVVGGFNKEKDLNEKAKAANEVAVSVRGSSVHGWGLFADQTFKRGDVVAEYIGEYVSLAVTEAREKMYRDQRIQDYQFRLDDKLVIDATMRGGHGRYINHNCNPNCVAQIIPGGVGPNEHFLKRVIIIAQQKIEPREELTYDYQFPLELDLAARIPCNCMSDHCRGFMNWDLPEKGSNNQVFRSQKRGANMRDRIRRLGRPLKSDRGDDDDDADDHDHDHDHDQQHDED
jgi:hypothetical protein